MRELGTADVIALTEKYQMGNYTRHPVAFVRGEGARLFDAEGREYLDFLGGIAVTLLGHTHPEVTRAVTVQARNLLHVSNLFHVPVQSEAARLLSEATIGGKVFFCNSGTEANEAAIKLARKYAYKTAGESKHEIVSALKSFHGRTLATVTATGQPKYHEGFRPLPPGFLHVPYNDVKALQGAVNERTCAVLLEPILGESGVYPATPEYLAAARELCSENKAALIFDEVQTGLGRTGKWFAYQHYGIEPDVLTLAKGLGGGVPIGAMMAREPVASAFQPGDHASTFGGSALPAAAALATLRVIEEEKLVENAARVGAILAQGLEALRQKCGLVTEIRARGLMIGVDLAKPVAGQVKSECAQRGLLIITVGDQMLRLLPPLVLSEAQADKGLAILAGVLAEVERG